MQPFAKTVTLTGTVHVIKKGRVLMLIISLPDISPIRGDVATKTIPYDYLVCAVGAETQTFNIPGVKEHAVFMKEIGDAERVDLQLIG